jgi:hypothetical protein
MSDIDKTHPLYAPLQRVGHRVKVLYAEHPAYLTTAGRQRVQVESAYWQWWWWVAGLPPEVREIVSEMHSLSKERQRRE